jgi:hypothetical protein
MSLLGAEDMHDINFFSEQYFHSLPTFEAQVKYFNNFCCAVENKKLLYRYKLHEPTLHWLYRETKHCYQTKKSLALAHMSLYVKGTSVPFIKEWLKVCNVAKTALYVPMNNTETEMNAKFGDVSKGYINTFLGYSDDCKKHPTLPDNTPDRAKIDKVLSIFLDLGLNLAEGNQILFEQLLIIIAKRLKNPASVSEVCPVIIGYYFEYNDFFWKIIGLLFQRRHYNRVYGLKHLFSASSALDLVNKLMINVSEMTSNDSLKFDDKMKTLMTKNKSKYDQLNGMFIVGTTDNSNLITESTGERLFFPLLATEEYLEKPDKFWVNLMTQCNTAEFIGSLYWYLMNVVDTTRENRELFKMTNGTNKHGKKRARVQ